MAEGKKSFIVYCDLIHVVSKLPNEKAGELFKFILEYVNDNNPQTDDLLLQILFEPIKLQMKRDLQKWEKESVKRSDSGRLGGLKSGEARRKQKEANEASALNLKQDEANEAVTVTVNDTVINNTVLSFEKFWDMYDKKEGRKDCEKKYIKVKEADRLKILETLPKYILSTPDKKFRKNPETYLNGEHWNDELKNIQSEDQKFIRKFENGKEVDVRKYKPGTLFSKTGDPIFV